MRYYFNRVETCNMCGSNISNHVILGKRLNASQGWRPQKKIGITTTIMQCFYCGLIYSNPQPIPNNFQDHYGIPPESYWSNDYSLRQQEYFDIKIDRLCKLMPITGKMKSLDVGAGIGNGMLILQKLGFDAYGLEPSDTFYQYAILKRNIRPEKLSHSSIETTDYPAQTFDYITFDGVFEHLFDPDKSIKKALSWLKPDGIIHIEVPSSDWLISKLLNFYFKVIGTDYVTNTSPMHAPFHLYEFKLKSFIENSRRNNYEITFYEYRPCKTFMPHFLDKFIAQIMKATNTGMQLSVWIRKIKL